MTALNFPNSPVNGQTYEGYTYNSTKGVWEINVVTPGIGGLVGVNITSPASGEVLKYDGANWVNRDVYNQNTTSTGYFMIPAGTEAQRPASPQAGHIRFNSDTGEPEWYSVANSEWYRFRQLPTFNVEYLVIAGGGGGGAANASSSGGGGGGAGGYRCNVSGESSGGPGSSAEASLALESGTYTVTVGAGGAGKAGGGLRGSVGFNSVFASVTSSGGGGGGGSVAGANEATPSSGGSGGGANAQSGSNISGASGVTGQGFAGGDATSATSNNPNYPSAGGGGAGQLGQNAVSTSVAGAGGNGVASSITGSSITRGGGGGGATFNGGTPGAGGAGGGAVGNGGVGVVNTGGGGGGAANGATSGAGGSGVVILRYPSNINVEIGAGLVGITVTSGSNKITTFTSGTDTIVFS